MTRDEELNEIAKTLDIPEEHMVIFRIGYYQGKMDQLEENRKIRERILNSKILEDVTD